MRKWVFLAGLFFVLIDGLMTWGFGLFLDGQGLFKHVLAFAVGGASVVLGAVFVPLAVKFYQMRMYVMFALMAFVLVVGYWANLASNAGFSAAMLQSNITKASNQNQRADLAASEVKRLEKRIDEIRRSTTWQTTYLAPTAYDKLIVAAELIRDNEAKRGGCGRICEEKTRELQTLRANKANAERRQAQRAELVMLERELAEAKQHASKTQKAISAASSQAQFMASFVVGSLRPGEETVDWTTRYTALGVSFIVSLIGWSLTAASMALGGAPVRQETPVYGAPRALPDATPLHVENPAQAAAERDQRMSVYREVRTETQLRDESWERLREQIRSLGGTAGFDARKASEA